MMNKKQDSAMAISFLHSRFLVSCFISCLDQSEVDPHALGARVSAPGLGLVVEGVPQPHAELPGGKGAETLRQVEVSLDLGVESVSLV